MTDSEITALAREYAEELCPDNKLNREMIELDCLGFLDRVLNSYCLVKKKDVEAKYQEAKERYFNPDDEIEKNNVWWKNVNARIPLPRNRKGGGIMKNAPERIYLNIGDGVPDDVDFRDLSEVSWSEERINDNDIEYVIAKEVEE